MQQATYELDLGTQNGAEQTNAFTVLALPHTIGVLFQHENKLVYL